MAIVMIPYNNGFYKMFHNNFSLLNSDYNGKFVHCKNERKLKLSVRNSKVMKNGIFCLENLPTLLLTHATTFLLGAAL